MPGAPVVAVGRRLDVDVMDLDLGFRILRVFGRLGWPSFQFRGFYDDGRKWRPDVFSCVGVAKRFIPRVPWYIWTPTGLLQWCTRNVEASDGTSR